ncbi:hypothetical protein HS088_TW15G01345 [Tripterygium wilfordii]|uniref:Uncharacterized protein n=1 Tax=Tripterygium wilfordii TaxID=458696 RepID=A0A7J7CPD6_TRIWF|nr:hypothetical protein HS088_TW15G01345 [Tripterygium wilfordii]
MTELNRIVKLLLPYKPGTLLSLLPGSKTKQKERDGSRLGAGGGCGGYVHPLIARITIPATGEDEGDGVWEHVYKWDCYSSPCRHLLLHNHYPGRCYWHSYTSAN